MNKRGMWVVLALFGGLFFVLFALLAVTAQAVRGEDYSASSGQGIGVIEINGEIHDSKRELKWIRGFAEEPSIKAVLVRIDSPGGAVGPSQEIYSELKRLDEKKPVIASMGSVAASGGYYIALGARKIFANPGTLTGSIGVIMQTLDASRLMPLTKLDLQTYKSGDLKDMGSPLRTPTEKDREVFAALIHDVYEQFVSAIAQSRGLEEQDVRAIADGRVFTGAQAAAKKLIDGVGTFQTAVETATELGAIKQKPELVYPPEDEGRGALLRFLREASKSAVRGAVEAAIGNGAFVRPSYIL